MAIIYIQYQSYSFLGGRMVRRGAVTVPVKAVRLAQKTHIYDVSRPRGR